MEHLRVRTDLVLRVGIGLVLLYAGFNTIGHPDNWIGFVPQWIANFVDRAVFLKLHAVGEIILGLGLLSGFYLPIFAGLAALDFLSILLFYGVDDITFRDIGLLAATLALFLQSRKNAGVAQW